MTFGNVDKPNSKFNSYLIVLYQATNSVPNLKTALEKLVSQIEIENLLQLKLKFPISDGFKMRPIRVIVISSYYPIPVFKKELKQMQLQKHNFKMI